MIAEKSYYNNTDFIRIINIRVSYWPIYIDWIATILDFILEF